MPQGNPLVFLRFTILIIVVIVIVIIHILHKDMTTRTRIIVVDITLVALTNVYNIIQSIIFYDMISLYSLYTRLSAILEAGWVTHCLTHSGSLSHRTAPL